MATVTANARKGQPKTEGHFRFQEWLTHATRLLDSYEADVRGSLAALAAEPIGTQAARKRELRRRARIPNLGSHLEHTLQHIALTRDALAAYPQAGRAVYHALAVGMLWQYPHAERARELRQSHREAAIETNRSIKDKKKRAAR